MSFILAACEWELKSCPWVPFPAEGTGQNLAVYSLVSFLSKDGYSLLSAALLSKGTFELR